MIPLLYLLFFLSGAAGLMYESVWSRYLGLFVGHQAYAQVLVLVIFLGGMSLGAALVSRRAERVKDPLRLYALVEIAVGVIGLAFHPIFVAATGWAYDSAFPALAGGAAATALKWGLAALLILPQSILLGTTFPLMSAGVLRRAPKAPGEVLGWLYFTNSIGAAVGVLVAGIVLVDLFGMRGVLVAAAALNVLVALGAFGAGAGHPAPVPVENADAPTEAPRAPADGVERLLLASAFFTAVASFCYEIDWIRMLSLVLGSATRSFELMLSAFILGLALGAFWIRRRSDRFAEPMKALAIIQIVMGVLAVATLPVYLGSFRAMEVLLAALAENRPGYLLYNLARYGFCLAVMLPATFCAGMTLPLITRMLMTAGRGEAAIGRVYAVNTLGSIIGAALAGMLLLPLLGLRGLALFGGAVDVAVGIVLLRRSSLRRWTVPATAALAAGWALLFLAVRFDRATMVAGVFRERHLDEVHENEILYYADGRTATVSVERTRAGWVSLATNGKVDASVTAASRRACTPSAPARRFVGDEVTQILTGLLPLGFVRDGGTAALIGIGSGISGHMLLADTTLRRVETVEIEPRMVDGARFFMPTNRRTFEDPRSVIVLDDAKSYFAANGQRYDLIVSEPSNPWVKGVSSLFTVEFYERIKHHLAKGGMLAQWLQTYELDDASVLTVLASLDRVFPDWRVHQVGAGDLLFIASADGPVPEPDWARVLAFPGLREDFCGVAPLDEGTLASSLLARPALLRPLLDRWTSVNSDYDPQLDLRAERRRFERGMGGGFLMLGDAWFNPSRALTDGREAPVPTLSFPFEGQRLAAERVFQTWQQRTEVPDTLLAPKLAQARYDWLRWRAGLTDPASPGDWRPWVAAFTAVAKVRHAGAAGWIDSTFFADADAFAARHGAPGAVRAVVAFRRGVQGWDDSTTLRAAVRLADTLTMRYGWVDPDELREGATIAALRLGRPALAKTWWEQLAPAAKRRPEDMRVMLLDAHVEAANAAPAKP